MAPDLLKTLVILSDATVKRSAVDREDLKPYRKSEKKTMFVLMINNPIIYKLFKGFTSYRKPFLNILNTVTTGKTFQQSGKWNSFRHLLKSSAGMYESLDS